MQTSEVSRRKLVSRSRLKDDNYLIEFDHLERSLQLQSLAIYSASKKKKKIPTQRIFPRGIANNKLLHVHWHVQLIQTVPRGANIDHHYRCKLNTLSSCNVEMRTVISSGNELIFSLLIFALFFRRSYRDKIIEIRTIKMNFETCSWKKKRWNLLRK